MPSKAEFYRQMAEQVSNQSYRQLAGVDRVSLPRLPASTSTRSRIR